MTSLPLGRLLNFAAPFFVRRRLNRPQLLVPRVYREIRVLCGLRAGLERQIRRRSARDDNASVEHFERESRGITSETQMIIWGWKSREKRIGTGSFYCLSCGAENDYTHYRVSQYFTLYFIPLFPMSTLGEYVQCSRCTRQFAPEVLDLTREQIEAALAPWSCSCGNRNHSSDANCLSCGSPRPPS